MADNYLERHYEEYAKRRQEWQKKHNNSTPRDYNPWSD